MNLIQAIAGARKRATAAGIVTSELLSRYDFGNTSCYPGTGTAITDLQGNYNLTAVGAAYNSGDGGHFDFDGTNDYLSSAMEFNGQNAATICMWIRTTGTTRATILGSYSGNASTLSDAFQLEINRGSVLNEQDSIFVFARGYNTNNSTYVWYAQNTGISDGNWHLVTAVADLANRTCNIYVDNVAYSVTQRRADTVAWSNFWQFGNYIGAMNNQGTAGTFYVGDIGQTLVYSDALSASEATQNWNATKGTYGL